LVPHLDNKVLGNARQFTKENQWGKLMRRRGNASSWSLLSSRFSGSRWLTGFIAVLTIATLFYIPAGCQSLQANSNLLDGKPHQWPGYDELPSWAKQVYTPQSYDEIRNSPDLELVHFHYPSDGLKVAGFLYKPRFTEGKKLPLILWCHGGVGKDAAISNENFGDLHEMYRLASAGFLVLAPQYRGVDGGEGKDEVGGADVHDILNLVPIAESLQYADMDRLFIVGFSRGAMMALQSIRMGLHARAAVVVGVPVDWQLAAKDNPTLTRIAEENWPDYKTNRDEAFRSRSPAFWADQINVPVLIFAGALDPAFPPRQPLLLAEKLAEANKLFELIIYANDDHPVSRHADERMQKTIDWFQNPRKTSIMSVLFKTIRNDGTAKAVEQYRALKKSKPDWYDFGENELNTLGFTLLVTGKHAEAVEMFKLNAEAYPGSANAYDSLGEGYESTTDKALAVKCYQRAIELDNHDQRARRALARLQAASTR
jgi:dienelactone hydrolase